MKPLKNLSIAVMGLLLLLTVMLSSCAMLLADHGTFDGGEILNDEKLSEIRSKIFASDQVESERMESSISDSDQIEQTQETEDITEKFGHTSADSSFVEQSTVFETDSTQSAITPTVYWTQNGEVWHTKKDCRYLKNKKVISGTNDDAVNAGKSRLCSSCGK